MDGSADEIGKAGEVPDEILATYKKFQDDLEYVYVYVFVLPTLNLIT